VTDTITNPDGLTAEAWLVESFEYESCHECGKDEDAHVAIMFMGNWFALCDPSLPTGQFHLRDIRLRNNAGMDFPLCAADEELLDLDKGRWPTTGSMDEVTCPDCRRKAPIRYSWASFGGDAELAHSDTSAILAQWENPPDGRIVPSRGFLCACRECRRHPRYDEMVKLYEEVA